MSEIKHVKPDVFFCDYSPMPLLLVDPGQAGKMTVTAKQVSILVVTNVMTQSVAFAQNIEAWLKYMYPAKRWW